MRNTTDYVPTPEQIRESCLEIQKGWTSRERKLRRGVTEENPLFEVPVISIRELGSP